MKFGSRGGFLGEKEVGVCMEQGCVEGGKGVPVVEEGGLEGNGGKEEREGGRRERIGERKRGMRREGGNYERKLCPREGKKPSCAGKQKEQGRRGE